MHNFKESLAVSHAAEDLPLWEECYRRMFPTMAAMVNHRADGWHQRLGIDRSVILADSRQYKIDEKIRWRNKKTGIVYKDIAIEEFSDLHRQKPGWASKPLIADYLAYAIGPIGKCYLMPIPQLQSAWAANKDYWKKQFPRPIDAPNDGYTTRSYGIPVNILFGAIGATLRCDFTPCEEPTL
jgi:hypothetical protein